MDNRSTEITVIKGKNPEEIVVFYASSLKDEIRFYINNELYITSFERSDGSIGVEMRKVEMRKEVEEKTKNTKPALDIIKENFKEFLKYISLMILVYAGLITLASTIYYFTNSIMLYLILISTVFMAFDVIKIMALELDMIPQSVKSKHSAEHMMVNFLEANKRLPKNMQEIRKCSRFSDECGSRHLIRGIAEKFIARILASIMAVVASSIYLIFFDNGIIDLVIFLVSYFVTSFLVEKLLIKYEKLEVLISPLKRILTNIAQCANTTKKVEDKDICLAYCAASEWMRIVYPEFYNENEDVFFENYPN